MTFDPRDPATWLPTLTVEQVAAIYQRPVGGIRKKCQQHTFLPAPFQRHPYSWKTVDVKRHLGLAPMGLLRRSA